MQEPTDPVLPCGVEKIVTDDGREFLLDNAKVVHIIEGRVIKGYVVDPVSGKTTPEMAVVGMNRVTRHVAMGWRNSDRSLHETSVAPWSVQR